MRYIIKLSISNIIMYGIIPSYLLSGGYFLYDFKYVLPISMFIIVTILFIIRKINIVNVLIKKYYFFIVLVIYSGISLCGATGSNSYMEFFQIIMGVIIILIMEVFINNEIKINKMVKVIKFIILILCLHAILGYYSGLGAKATYSNVNRLTTFLLFFSPIIFSEILYKKTKIKLYNICLLFLIFITVFFASSRLNLLAYLIQLLIFIFSCILHSKLRKKKVIILVLIFLIIISFPFVTFKILNMDHEGSLIWRLKNYKSSSIYNRVYMIREGIRLFKESNYLGVGAGNIKIRKSSNFSQTQEASLHNFIIELLASYGLIPFFFFIYMYIKLTKSYIDLRKKVFKSKIISLLMFLITFPIISNSPSSLFDFRPFYFIFAFYFIFIKLMKRNIDFHYKSTSF